MNSLYFRFTCLEGNYEFRADFDDKKGTYSIETDIAELENKSGDLPEEFISQLNNAEIEKWDKRYDGQRIEDGTSWRVSYIKDDKTYISSGEESYYPYNYNNFLEAIKMCDEKAVYFE